MSESINKTNLLWVFVVIKSPNCIFDKNKSFHTNTYCILVIRVLCQHALVTTHLCTSIMTHIVFFRGRCDVAVFYPAVQHNRRRIRFKHIWQLEKHSKTLYETNLDLHPILFILLYCSQHLPLTRLAFIISYIYIGLHSLA